MKAAEWLKYHDISYKLILYVLFVKDLIRNLNR